LRCRLFNLKCASFEVPILLSKYWVSSPVAGGEEENHPSPGRTLTFPLTEPLRLCIKPF
jgi:hypothetical protein